MDISVDSLLENSKGLDLVKYIKQNGDRIMPKLIKYLISQPNILLHNQRQCYLYPFRAAEILALEEVCKMLLKKDTNTNKHPYLDQLFAYLSRKQFMMTTSGYFERVAVRLLNLSPELYEYIRDREYLCDQICTNIKDPCICGFVSGMLMKDSQGIFVFFKKQIIRRLTSQALSSTNVEFFQGLTSLTEALIAGKESEDKTQIMAMLSARQFIDVLILKLSDHSNRLTQCAITIILHCLRGNSNKLTLGYEQLKSSLTPRAEILSEVFESYEESDEFSNILPHCIYILSQLFLTSITMEIFEEQAIIHEYLKRLLVYSSILVECSILHVQLWKLLKYLLTKTEIYTNMLMDLRIVTFLWNAYKGKRCSMRATCLKIFEMLLESSHQNTLEQKLIECPEWLGILEVLKEKTLSKTLIDTIDEADLQKPEKVENTTKT